jgi:hypothetical protein
MEEEEENAWYLLVLLVHQSLLGAEHHWHNCSLLGGELHAQYDKGVCVNAGQLPQLGQHTHHQYHQDTMRQLFCMWGVVVVESIFYCVYIFFRWRTNMLINFLNYDCLFSNLSGGKYTLHHSVPEGDHTAAY